MDTKTVSRKIASLCFLLIGLTTAAAAPPTPDHDGITPKQLATLSSMLQGVDGEITDIRLVADKTVGVVVSSGGGWQLYVFKRISNTSWKKIWGSGALGEEFSLADPQWKVYFSSCGPVVFEFDGCRKYQCSTDWGIIVFDTVLDEVAEARSLDGSLSYSGQAGRNSRSCAKEQLQKAIAEKKSDSEPSQR